MNFCYRIPPRISPRVPQAIPLVISSRNSVGNPLEVHQDIFAGIFSLLLSKISTSILAEVSQAYPDGIFAVVALPARFPAVIEMIEIYQNFVEDSHHECLEKL